MSALRRALLIGSIGWAALLPLASFAASRPAPAHGWYAAAFLVYGMGSAICHQLPARSFELWATQMPVCARCTGIYAGAALASAFVSLQLMAGQRALPSHGSARTHRAWLAAAALPTVATVLFEWTTGVTPSNAIRAGAGLPLGAAIVLVIVFTLQDSPRSAMRSA